MNHLLPKLLSGALLVAGLTAAHGALADHRGDNTVLIGGAISQTGRYSEPAGRSLNSIKLWVEDVNKRGGLLDRKSVV